MVTHAAKTFRRHGGIVTTSVCGRINRASADGMNIAEKPELVTCKFCLRRLATNEGQQTGGGQ